MTLLQPRVTACNSARVSGARLTLLNTPSPAVSKLRAMNTSLLMPGSEAPMTPFLNTLAVETWDTWFRWRDDGQLRDITIDDTWQRVAAALAGGPAQPAGYHHRLIDAFAAWRLLLDERIIATAGTAAPQWRADNLRAVLNAAVFVRAPGLPHASFDHAQFEEVAALALHALDDAVALADDDSWPDPQVRVGVIGVGDALTLLNLDYDSDGGRAKAANIARSLACGCLAGTIALAQDRGARAQCAPVWGESMHQRGYPRELIDGALRHGLRQRELTAITSQPRLAAFANGVADALDPLPEVVCADSYTSSVGRRARGTAGATAVRAVHTCVDAQLRLRAAVQPWIDERIAYPLNLEGAPSAPEISAWNALARTLDLGPLTWRFRLRNTPAADTAEFCGAETE